MRLWIGIGNFNYDLQVGLSTLKMQYNTTDLGLLKKYKIYSSSQRLANIHNKGSSALMTHLTHH